MKIDCNCGSTVVDSDSTQKYRWLSVGDWEKLLDTIDTEIENSDGSEESKENAIMKIRYAEKTNQIWECGNCGRFITIKNGDVIFLKQEPHNE